MPGDPRARLSYGTSATGLWVPDGGAWRQVRDPLLLKQVDQRAVALTADGDDAHLLTASVVLDVELFWRLD